MELMGNRNVLLGAIVVVAAVCVGVGVFSVVGVVSPSKAPKAVEPSYEFLCEKCQAVSSLRQNQIPAEVYEAITTARPAAMDCPRCGAHSSAYPPTRCPKCGKPYISNFSKGIIAPPGSQQREVCPHCGTDPYIWHRQHVKPEV